MSDSQAQLSQKRYLIGSVLSPAVQLWLRSQAERVDRLEVHIAGRNREILNGYIPSIAISANRVVYRGLHLSQLDIKGENIRINLHQVLKGKPLRLLEPVSVKAQLHLNEPDFNACLGSQLLEDAVREFFQPLLPYPIRLSTSRLELDTDRLILTVTEPQTMILKMGVKLSRHDKIELVSPQLQTTTIPPVSMPLEDIEFNLGSDVFIEELILRDRQLYCRGSIVVQTNEDLMDDS
jgi:LmeA-like phospholipid-binding